MGVTIIKEQIEQLKKQLASYQKYVMNLPIYEYHIDKIKVEKVKGILQLGELLDDEENDHKGIHKVFIQDLTIREIEGSGIVGIGLTEKDVKKKQNKKIPPSEANKEIKAYDEIKEVIHLNGVPIFFQQLAVKEKVLEEVWNYIKGNESFQQAIKALAKHAHSKVESIATQIVSEIPNYDLIQNEVLCKKLIKEIANLSKTFGIVLLLLDQLLSAYRKGLRIGELEKIEKEKPEKIMSGLKKAYHLPFLTDAFKKLKEHPTTLFTVYDELFLSLNKKGKDKTFLETVHEEVIVQEPSWAEMDVEDLSIDERSFLYAVLIQQYAAIPVWMYLDKIVLFICKSKQAHGK